MRQPRHALFGLTALLVLSCAAVAENDSVLCSTGRQLALAFANASVGTAVITRGLELTEHDWEGLPQPVVIRRNFTILGAPGTLPIVHFINNTRKVQLAGGGVMRMKNIGINGTLRQRLNASPGSDILCASPPDPGLNMFLIEDAMVFAAACYPIFIADLNSQSASRSRRVAGANQVKFNVSQEGCVNDTDADPIRRCWPELRLFVDLALEATELASTGVAALSNYVIQMLNVSSPCETVLSVECVQRYGPIGCRMKTWGEVLSSAPPRPSDAAAGITDSVELSVVTPEPAPAESAGGPNGAMIAAIAGAVGGTVLVGTIAVAAWLHYRRRARSRPRDLPADDSKRGPPPVDHAGKAARSGDPGVVPTAAFLNAPDSGTCGGGSTGTAARELSKHGDTDGDGGSSLTSTALAARSTPSADRPIAAGARAIAPAMYYSESVTASATGRLGESSDVVSYATPLDEDICLTALANDEVRLEGGVLGKGTYGQVRHGTFRGQNVAVKILKGSGLDTVAAVQDKAWEAHVGTLWQEVQVLARCRHPNVVRLLAANLGPPCPCLVMELMEGNLEQLIHGGHDYVIPIPTVVHIAVEIARGLEYLHPTVVHRDLKPSNVLLNGVDTARPVVKLADFGISRLRHTELPTRSPEAGTPPYMAPECFEPGNYIITHKVDIFALGVIMAEMLSGKAPWANVSLVWVASQVALYGNRPPLLGNLPPDRLPPKLGALVERCWEQDPQRRPAAAEVMKELMLVQQIMRIRGEAATSSRTSQECAKET